MTIKKLPAWYWHSGLHDACITEVNMLEFPGYHGGKDVSNARNCLVLKINASGAMYDRAVREIRLMNYEILSEDRLLPGRAKVWWLSDRLSMEADACVLEMDLLDRDRDPEEFTCKVRFDFAEVDRHP